MISHKYQPSPRDVIELESEAPPESFRVPFCTSKCTYVFEPEISHIQKNPFPAEYLALTLTLYLCPATNCAFTLLFSIFVSPSAVHVIKYAFVPPSGSAWLPVRVADPVRVHAALSNVLEYVTKLCAAYLMLPSDCMTFFGNGFV